MRYSPRPRRPLAMCQGLLMMLVPLLVSACQIATAPAPPTPTPPTAIATIRAGPTATNQPTSALATATPPDSSAPATAPPTSITVTATPSAANAMGPAARGAVAYQVWCNSCHPGGSAGYGREALWGRLTPLTDERIRHRIRQSDERERRRFTGLPDETLAEIIAYIDLQQRSGQQPAR